MDGAREKLMSLLRKEDYEQEANENKILEECQTEYYNGLQSDMRRRSLPKRRFDFELAYAKEIISECVGDLYVSSLIIDEPEKYSDTLKKEMRNSCMELMESTTTVRDLQVMFENANMYVKDMFPLIESILNNKTDEDVEKFDGKVFLTPDDKKLINNFESEEGKDIYADELQNRVLDVYKKEQECGEERQQKVQAVVDELNAIAEKKKANGETSDTIAESVEHGMNQFGVVPTSLFNAIFVNKSKMALAESASANLSDNAEEILAETICTYTLLECISALGLHTYSEDELRNLKFELYTAAPVA